MYDILLQPKFRKCLGKMYYKCKYALVNEVLRIFSDAGKKQEGAIVI